MPSLSLTLRPAGTLSGDDAGGGEEPGANAPEALESDEFEVEGELGRGGMGVVYRATQRSLARPVALKAIRAELASGPATEKFVAEALVTGRLEHPNIPPVHTTGRDEHGRGKGAQHREHVPAEPVEGHRQPGEEAGDDCDHGQRVVDCVVAPSEALLVLDFPCQLFTYAHGSVPGSGLDAVANYNPG